MVGTWRPSIATFNGKHNQVKGMVLIVLYLHGGRGLSLEEITKRTGQNYQTISNSFKKWVRFKLIVKRVGLYKNRPSWLYSIAAGGVHYVKDVIPPEKYQQWVKEIEEVKKNVA